MEYDALLYLSFGGPEGMQDVEPYLDHVLSGLNIPAQRRAEVVHHYALFDGISPINEQNRAVIAALEAELAVHAIGLPVYFGNRNWHPLLPDVVRQMAGDGVQRVLTFVTSAYSSYSGCRQYRENIQAATEEAGLNAMVFDKIRVFFNHPGFIQANADHLQEAMEQIAPNLRGQAPLLFTAHSIPHAMSSGSRYEEQLTEACALVAEAAGREAWRLVYQSRSGPPHQPWLEPDVCAVIRDLAGEGATDVVVAPIGFVSDHIEILFDLDVEALEVASEVGVRLYRAATVGTHPAYIAMIRELIQERVTPGTDRRSLGSLGPSHDVCPTGCCAYK